MTNLYPEVVEQLDYFVEKFKSIGWKQEDLHYLIRDTDFITHPDSVNEKFKHQFGMVLYAKLLSYNEDNKYNLTPWICCSITISPEDIKYQSDSKRLKQVANLIKSDLSTLGIKPFSDEDSFQGNFSKPQLHKDRDSVSMQFYINKDYPNGYRENHTIE